MNRIVYPLLAVVVGSALGGCGYIRTARDDVPMVTAPAVARMQTLNPEASKNTKVVAGLDSQAAANVSQSYADSFKRESQQESAAATFLGLTGLEND